LLFNNLEYFLFFGTIFFYQWYIHPYLFKDPNFSRKSLHAILLVCSYFFYMSWDYRFGGLILLSTIIDYFLALKIDSEINAKLKKFYLQLSLILNLVFILGFFKYYNFIINSANSILNLFDYNNPLPGLYIVLPVGISFFTFQSMSYTIDVYKREIPVEKSFVKFALFVSFFPQLVAGPIVTAKTFMPQLEKLPKFEEIHFLKAIRYFLMGYIKKVIISDNISPIIDLIFQSPGEYGTAATWLAAILFVIQVYSDFSGYSDMAYGSGLLLGFELPENFRMPLIGRNFTDLWRRWHISLSSWLKDYLYFSLGGSRVGYFRHKINLFLTMLIAGLWHGASWNFVIWGGIQGLILALESAYHQKFKIQETISAFRYIVQNAMTLFFFALIGVLFRPQEFDKAQQIYYNLFFYHSKGLRPYMLKIGLAVIFTVIVSNIIGYFIFEKNKKFSIPPQIEFFGYAFGVLILSLLTNDNVVPFIYFQF
jgi:alginate O-acetyltransferase complex protein AlgI